MKTKLIASSDLIQATKRHLPLHSDNVSQFLGHFNRFYLESMTFYFKGELSSFPLINMILFDNPMDLSLGIQTISRITRGHDHVHLRGFFDDNSDFFRTINQQEKLQNIKIWGMLGQGNFSTTLLLENDTILKLSRSPIYPYRLIEGVDLPFFDQGYASESDKTALYWYKQPLVVLHEMIPIPRSTFDQLSVVFLDRIRQFNRNYDLARDFQPWQLGWYEGQYYLFDYGCIFSRPLVEKSR